MEQGEIGRLVGGPPRLALDDIVNHPRMPLARKAYIDRFLEVYSGDPFLVRLLIESARFVVYHMAKWEVMDKTALRGIFEFDQSILDALSKAKRLTVDFEDDDDDSIEVQIPKAGEMPGALKFCEENKK